MRCRLCFTLEDPGHLQPTRVGAQQSRYLPHALCRALATAAGASARPWVHTCSSSAPSVSACAARTRGHLRLQVGNFQRGIQAGASPQHQELLSIWRPLLPQSCTVSFHASSLCSHRAPQTVKPQLFACTGTPALCTFNSHTGYKSHPVVLVLSPMICVV